MSCPNCRCYRCQRRNPTPWASHMDAAPIANNGPATSLETSMTEHFLGPMRNPYRGFETSDERIRKLIREYIMTRSPEMYERLLRMIARTGRPLGAFLNAGQQLPPPYQDNPWDSREARIKKLCLFSDLTPEEISDAMDIPYNWAVDACRTYRRDFTY